MNDGTALGTEIPADLQPRVERLRSMMGFVPSDVPVLARKPRVLDAFLDLASAVNGPGLLPPDLKRLVGLAFASSAGSTYCQAHTAAMAERFGATPESIAAAFTGSFEAPGFDERERAVLQLAFLAGTRPSTLGGGLLHDLRAHFGEDEIVEIVAVISFYAWLVQWHDLVATSLEAPPAERAAALLGELGWAPGNHGGPPVMDPG